MEAQVIYQKKSTQIGKNLKLNIIRFLIENGVYVDSIQCTNQDLYFKYNDSLDKDNNAWCEELNSFFKGEVDFVSKRTN